MKFGLENIARLCAALGNPAGRVPLVIVAGTNGKGSVTAMVDTALRAAGHRSARYTSPHLAAARGALRHRRQRGRRPTRSRRRPAASSDAAEALVASGALDGAADLLRVHDRGRLRAVPRRRGRHRGPRGRPRRPPGRDQHRLADRRRHRLDRLRSPGAAGPHRSRRSRPRRPASSSRGSRSCAARCRARRST